MNIDKNSGAPIIDVNSTITLQLLGSLVKDKHHVIVILPLSIPVTDREAQVAAGMSEIPGAQCFRIPHVVFKKRNHEDVRFFCGPLDREPKRFYLFVALPDNVGTRFLCLLILGIVGGVDTLESFAKQITPANSRAPILCLASNRQLYHDCMWMAQMVEDSVGAISADLRSN